MCFPSNWHRWASAAHLENHKQGGRKKSLSECSVVLRKATMSPQPGFWTIFLKSGNFEKLGWGDIVFLKMTEDSERDFFGTPCSVCVWNNTWQITSIVHHLYLVFRMEQQPSDWPWKVSAIIVINVVWHTDCMNFNKTVFLAILCDRIWCDYIWFVIDYSWVQFWNQSLD